MNLNEREMNTIEITLIVEGLHGTHVEVHEINNSCEKHRDPVRDWITKNYSNGLPDNLRMKVRFKHRPINLITHKRCDNL